MIQTPIHNDCQGAVFMQLKPEPFQPLSIIAQDETAKSLSNGTHPVYMTARGGGTTGAASNGPAPHSTRAAPLSKSTKHIGSASRALSSNPHHMVNGAVPDGQNRYSPIIPLDSSILQLQPGQPGRSRQVASPRHSANLGSTTQLLCKLPQGRVR